MNPQTHALNDLKAPRKPTEQNRGVRVVGFSEAPGSLHNAKNSGIQQSNEANRLSIPPSPVYWDLARICPTMFTETVVAMLELCVRDMLQFFKSVEMLVDPIFFFALPLRHRQQIR